MSVWEPTLNPGDVVVLSAESVTGEWQALHHRLFVCTGERHGTVLDGRWVDDIDREINQIDDYEIDVEATQQFHARYGRKGERYPR